MERELQIVVSHHIDARSQTFVRATSAFNHCNISFSPMYISFTIETLSAFERE